MSRTRKIIHLIFILTASIFLSSCGYEHEAYFQGEVFFFDGQEYEGASGVYDESNEILCKTKDYTIYAVVGDDVHNYVVARSFLDDYLYVKKDYERNKGKIVGLGFSANGYYNSDEKEIAMVSDILSRKPLSIAGNEEELTERSRSEGYVWVKYENDAVGEKVGCLLEYKGRNVLCRYWKQEAFG